MNPDLVVTGLITAALVVGLGWGTAYYFVRSLGAELLPTGVTAPDNGWLLVASGGSYNVTKKIVNGFVEWEEHHLSGVSVWRPGNRQAHCNLPNFKEPRKEHTLDNVVGVLTACGGWPSSSILDMFEKGPAYKCSQLDPMAGPGWTEIHQLKTQRYNHCSMSTPQGLLMIGGGGIDDGTGQDIDETTEILETYDGTEPGWRFPTKHSVSGSCGISTMDGVVITGGGYNPKNKVTKYNFDGSSIEDLPDLINGRSSHACGSISIQGQEVFVVAGGQQGSYPFDLMGSTEIFEGGRWKTFVPLPSPREGLKGLVMDGKFFVTGGACLELTPQRKTTKNRPTSSLSMRSSV